MAKQKFYVVWIGRKPGVYNDWDECNAQVNGFSGAKFKSFKTLRLAKEAFDKKLLATKNETHEECNSEDVPWT